MDFTIKTYRHLLISLKEAGYHFITFEEWCATHETVKTVILRHDVDKKPERSLALARHDVIQARNMLIYFRILAVGLVLLLIFRFSSFTSYLPLIAAFFAILTAYTFTLIRNLFYYIVFIVLCVMSVAFAFYQIYF